MHACYRDREMTIILIWKSFALQHWHKLCVFIYLFAIFLYSFSVMLCGVFLVCCCCFVIFVINVRCCICIIQNSPKSSILVRTWWSKKSRKGIVPTSRWSKDFSKFWVDLGALKTHRDSIHYLCHSTYKLFLFISFHSL